MLKTLKKMMLTAAIVLSFAMSVFAVCTPTGTLGQVVTSDYLYYRCTSVTATDMVFTRVDNANSQLVWAITTHDNKIAENWYDGNNNEWEADVNAVADSYVPTYGYDDIVAIEDSDISTTYKCTELDCNFLTFTSIEQDSFKLMYCITTNGDYVEGRWYVYNNTTSMIEGEIFNIVQGTENSSATGDTGEVAYYRGQTLNLIYADEIYCLFENELEEGMPKYLYYYFQDDGAFEEGKWYNGRGMEIYGGIVTEPIE